VQGVLAGFATIGIIIGLGFPFAHLRILDATALGVLTWRLLCGQPALMITVLGGIATLSQPGRIARQLWWPQPSPCWWSDCGGERPATRDRDVLLGLRQPGNLGLPIAAMPRSSRQCCLPAAYLATERSGGARCNTYVPSPGVSEVGCYRSVQSAASQPLRWDR
jgi:hypothetical protein